GGAGVSNGFGGGGRGGGRDGNVTAGAAGVLIPGFDSGAARHRGAARVLGTCHQRRAPGSRGGFSAVVRPLRRRSVLRHFRVRDGLLLRTTVRTARRSDQVLRPAPRAHRAALLGDDGDPGLVRRPIRVHEGGPRLAVLYAPHSVRGA